jgi:hypothetical protein
MKRRNEVLEGGKAEKRHVTRVPVFFFFFFFFGDEILQGQVLEVVGSVDSFTTFDQGVSALFFL